MVWSPLPKVIEVNDKHLANAVVPTLINEFGNVAEVKSDMAKADSPIVSNPSEKLTSVAYEEKNAPSPIDFNDEGNVNEVAFEYINAPSPIEVKVDGKVNEVIDFRYANANGPIISTPSGIEYEVLVIKLEKYKVLPSFENKTLLFAEYFSLLGLQLIEVNVIDEVDDE